MEKSRSTIIVVDDDITNLTITKNTLIGKYDILTAPSGAKLFSLLEKIVPDLILLDIEIPGMNGYEIIGELKSNPATAEIPVIFLTSTIDPESEVNGLNLGAIDYITKPFSSELLLKRIDQHLLLEKQKTKLKDYNQSLEEIVNNKTQTAFDLQNAILKTVADVVESRDSVIGGHIERTQKYLKMFIGFLIEHGVYADALSGWDIDLIIQSSQLHDVGKISIKDGILMKQSSLTEDEFDEMKMHALYGMAIIEKIESTTPESIFLKHAKVMAGSHHEKWDGTGYPFGLKEKAIPLQGRLMAIVDMYDVLTNDRPGRKKLTHAEAIQVVKEYNGTHFDPELVAVFLQHEKDFTKGGGEQ